MDRRKIAGMVGIGALCALVVLGVSTIYRDHVRQVEHDTKINDLTTFVNLVKPKPIDTAGERIIQLPEDGTKWYTTLFVSAKGTGPDAWFDQEYRLARLKQQTHFTVYDSGNKMYQTRWRGTIGDRFPCCVVQTSTGQVVYKASGESFPMSPSVLADQIAAAVSDCRPHPTPTPTPSPTPSPLPVVPDIGPPKPGPDGSDGDSMSLLYAALAALLGAGVKGVSDLKKSTVN